MKVLRIPTRKAMADEQFFLFPLPKRSALDFLENLCNLQTAPGKAAELPPHGQSQRPRQLPALLPSSREQAEKTAHSRHRFSARKTTQHFQELDHGDLGVFCSENIATSNKILLCDSHPAELSFGHKRGRHRTKTAHVHAEEEKGFVRRAQIHHPWRKDLECEGPFPQGRQIHARESARSGER